MIPIGDGNDVTSSRQKRLVNIETDMIPIGDGNVFYSELKIQ